MLQMFIGSEGILGVVTEVTLRIHPLPEVVEYGSLAFKCFNDGVECLRHLASVNCNTPTHSPAAWLKSLCFCRTIFFHRNFINHAEEYSPPLLFT